MTRDYQAEHDRLTREYYQGGRKITPERFRYLHDSIWIDKAVEVGDLDPASAADLKRYLLSAVVGRVDGGD